LDAGTFNNILNIPLDYVKGIARTGGNINSDNWNPWTSNFTNLTFDGYPQPIFADIEFDINGDAILVFNDRYGHQMSTFNYNTTTGTNLYTGISSGDILRAAYSSSSGIYTLENNGIVGGFTSSGGVGTNQGPGGGEFYYQEHYINYHNETVEGGAAFRPGSGQVAVAAYDPFIVYSAGIYWMNNINGSTTRKYQVNSQQEVTGSFGKTNGIGDIEMLCDPAPIEIGNRIWLDSDNDGIQDPEESTIAGVTVQLVNSAGTVIGTAVTNSTGNYLFSNAPGTSTSSFIYGITGLTENVNYTVRIPNASGAGQQSALSTYSLTTANVGGATGDIRDSDGTLVGTNAEASVLASQIPVSGANNHTFDFGFLLLSTCSLSSTGLANVQCNNNGTVATSTDDYITFSLNPSGSMLGSTYTVSSNNGGVVTPSSGSYGTSTNFRLQNGSANGSTIYTITITDSSGSPCQITVDIGPVSPCSSCPNPNCVSVTVTKN
jgi:hypothetical protein